MSRARDRQLVAGLALSETVSWGVLYYAFSVFLQPMQDEMGWSRSATSGAFSVALLVSAMAAPAAGWTVDRGAARALMTIGSMAGVLLVLAWSQVRSLVAFYAIWAALGLVMACVLYEPAFAVVARRFEGSSRQRALTSITLVAGLASTIFVPLAWALLAALGWRHALVVLALALLALTVPVHVLALRDDAPPRGDEPSRVGALPVIGSGRLLAPTLAFVLATCVSSVLGVHGVAYFTSQGFSAAQSAGLIAALGFMQLPARLLFLPVAARVRADLVAPAALSLPAVGLACLVGLPGTAGALLFVVLVGMGGGLATVVRAEIVAFEFGAARYGTVAGLMAGPVTAARAAGPIAAATLFDGRGSYDLLAPLLLVTSVLAVVVIGTWSWLRRPVPSPLPS